MTEPSDDDLLAELHQVGLLFDPLPGEVVAAARSAFAWRTIDAELAELVEDSSQGDRALAGVRGEAPVLLSFAVGDTTIEIEVVADGERRRLLGQLVPPLPGRVEVRHPGGTTSADADEMGRFAAYDLLPGPSSLRWQPASGSAGPAVETDWFLS